MYNSWELDIAGLRCNICARDTRLCDHVAGRWYEGIECHGTAYGPFTFVRSAIVSNPDDPRCRIWPWGEKSTDEPGKRVFTSAIFKLFDPVGEEDGGRVVDLIDLQRESRNRERKRRRNRPWP